MTLLTICSSLITQAQYFVDCNIDEDVRSRMKTSKLYVVQDSKDGISDYDKQIKEAMDTFWDFNDVEYIDTIRFRELNNNGQGFFLLKERCFWYRYNDEELREWHFFTKLTLIEAGNELTKLSDKAMKRIRNGIPRGLIKKREKLFSELERNKDYLQSRENPGIVSITLSADHDQITITSKFDHMIPVFVKQIQNVCKTGHNNSLKEEVQAARKENTMHKSPLYVLYDDLNDKVPSEEVVRKLYKGEVHVIEKKEMHSKVASDENANVVFCVSDDQNNYVFVYSIKTGQLLSHIRTIVHKQYPPGLLKAIIKRWN